eukprot:EG_transcript_4186
MSEEDERLIPETEEPPPEESEVPPEEAGDPPAAEEEPQEAAPEEEPPEPPPAADEGADPTAPEGEVEAEAEVEANPAEEEAERSGPGPVDQTDVAMEETQAAEDEKEALPSPSAVDHTQRALPDDEEQMETQLAVRSPEVTVVESVATTHKEGQAETTGTMEDTTLAGTTLAATELQREGKAVLPEAAPGEPTIEIKFVVAPEGFIHLQRVPISIRIEYLYDKLCDNFRCNRRHLRILYRGTVLMDEDVLSECINVVIDGQLLLNVELDTLPRHLQQLQKYELLESVLGVQVNYGDAAPTKTIAVAVVKEYQHKQYMGGYRNKKSGVQYHHAAAQTDARKREPKPKPPSYSRDTQTSGISRSMQTKREASTQMARPGLEIDASEDRWYVSKPYFSAKELHGLRVSKCIVLQAIVRGWFARRLARSLREQDRLRQDQLHQEELQRQRVHEAKTQREIERRTHPRTPADFAILYNELEAWRLQEAQKIKDSNLDEAEKHLARQELLKKETRLLQTIDKLQIKANAENKKEKIASELSAMAAQKRWKHSNPELGTTVVETPFTVRAKELQDLYNGLHFKSLSVDERLDILLHVKWTVKEFECALTREIVELIDREADLLNRGRKEKSLEGLRQRLSNLFLQFCETPEFNPEAINHQRVPLEFTTRPLVKIDALKR